MACEMIAELQVGVACLVQFAAVSASPEFADLELLELTPANRVNTSLDQRWFGKYVVLLPRVPRC